MSRTLLASCLCAGSLLLGASAQVTTASVYMPIAGDSESLMAEFQASIVTSVRSPRRLRSSFFANGRLTDLFEQDGANTVYAMSCTDGPCNPIAGGTGTLTFTEGPDSEYRHFLRCTDIANRRSLHLHRDPPGRNVRNITFPPLPAPPMFGN